MCRCSANLIGDRIYICGGYGGFGDVFGDVWALTVPAAGSGGAFQWQDLTAELQVRLPA